MAANKEVSINQLWSNEDIQIQSVKKVVLNQ